MQLRRVLSRISSHPKYIIKIALKPDCAGAGIGVDLAAMSTVGSDATTFKIAGALFGRLTSVGGLSGSPKMAVFKSSVVLHETLSCNAAISTYFSSLDMREQ